MGMTAGKGFLAGGRASPSALEVAETCHKIPALLPLWTRCGKPTCRCAGGSPHGPYAYRYWYEAGRRRKCYVPAARVAEVRAAVSRWRDLHPRLWSERRALAELRRLAEEVDAWT